jgi:hypothetical protein
MNASDLARSARVGCPEEIWVKEGALPIESEIRKSLGRIFEGASVGDGKTVRLNSARNLLAPRPPSSIMLYQTRPQQFRFKK